jgi:hypothetical protein
MFYTTVCMAIQLIWMSTSQYGLITDRLHFLSCNSRWYINLDSQNVISNQIFKALSNGKLVLALSAVYDANILFFH